MACSRTVFVAGVTRITAEWLNAIDKIKVALGCGETKEQVQSALDIVPRAEYQTTVNLLQGQINVNAADIDTLETCLDGYCIRVVTSLPATPNENIIYFVTG